MRTRQFTLEIPDGGETGKLGRVSGLSVEAVEARIIRLASIPRQNQVRLLSVVSFAKTESGKRVDGSLGTRLVGGPRATLLERWAA